MPNPYRAPDGTQITGTVSGFSEYATHDNPATVKPTPVLTPNDLLTQINSLKEFLNEPNIVKAIQMLTDHVNDTNNPHQVTLSALTESVIDVLYKYYVAQGGKLGSGTFKQELFKVLHVATYSEMKAGADETALISIKGAKEFIHDHETDPNAHIKLIQRILPGRPVTAIPTYAIHSRIGLANTLLKATGDVPYTYVSADRIVETVDDFHILPVDYTYKEPMFACFGPRTNLIPDSNDFNSLDKENVVVALDDSIYDPTNHNDATAVKVEYEEASDTVHSVSYPRYEIEINSSYTFSVYAKAGSCKYFMLSYVDMGADTITVRAIFDLKNGVLFLMNHMNRYKAELIPLANGWYRCSLSGHHQFGQIAAMKMTFFKEKPVDDQNYGFKGEVNEIVGYLYGMQREEGANPSPYIPTRGTTKTRLPVEITVPVDRWANGNAITYHAVFRQPGENLENQNRPLLTTLNSDDVPSMLVSLNSDTSVDFSARKTIMVDTIKTNTVVLHHVIIGEADNKYINVVYGQDDSSVTTAYHGETFLYDHLVERDSDAKLLIGRNADGEYAETYFRNLTVYPVNVNTAQCEFLNGELIHD